MLLDPRPSIHDATNGWIAHSIWLSERVHALAARMPGSDLADLVPRKLCKPAALSARIDTSALFAHVVHVVDLSSEEKMGRVTAPPVIAPMTNADALCSFRVLVAAGGTIGQLPGKSMSEECFTSVPDDSVPALVECTLPLPTAVTFLHTRPELFWRRLVGRFVEVCHLYFYGLVREAKQC